MKNVNSVYFVLIAAFFLALSSDLAAKIGLRGRALEKSWDTYRDYHVGDEPGYRFQYESCFRKAAKANKLPVTLLLAVARGESDFNPRAVSKANAIGIMQILWPATAKELGIHRKADLFKPCINIKAGARYLKFLMDRYDNNYYLALAAYNYGPHRIKVGSIASRIPKGAQWYSAYIYDHLEYVLGKGKNIRRRVNSKKLPKYSELGKYAVIVFNEPHRARAFRDHLQNKFKDMRFDWFDKGLGRFGVVMTYNGKREFKRNISRLRKLGL